MRFGICRNGTVTAVEGRRSGDTHVVLPFPVKAQPKGGEQLMVYRGSASEPVAVFADFAGLFAGF